jgi:hypothetical protein
VDDDAKKHSGSCHCSAIRYEVTIDASQGGRCNCSVCTKISPLGAIVKPDAFELLSSDANLSAYVWGGKISTRYFCRTCGVHCFSRGHLAEVGGDFVSINLNTLDDIDPSQVKVIHWDGRHDNWQAGPRDTPWLL